MKSPELRISGAYLDFEDFTVDDLAEYDASPWGPVVRVRDDGAPGSPWAGEDRFAATFGGANSRNYVSMSGTRAVIRHLLSEALRQLDELPESGGAR